MSFGPSLSKTSFPALPSTSFRPTLPPTSLRPSSGAPTPATPATRPHTALTPSIRPATSSTSAISIASTSVASATGTQKGVGMLEAEGTSSKTANRGGGGGGGGEAEFDVLDVMRYVESDLMDEANGLFKLTSRPGARRGSNESGSEGQVGGSPTAQNFMNEDILAATVMHFARRHELQKVERKVLAYLALATMQRLRVLIERMIHVSRHRRRSSSETFGPPLMYDIDHAMFHLGIGQDVKKQLLAIERVEREEELKYKEHIAVLHEQKLAASEDAKDGGGGKAKKRVSFGDDAKVKEPKLVLKKEKEKLRFANQTAMKFAGNRGEKRTYAWMTGSGGVLRRPRDSNLIVLDPSSPSSPSSSDFLLGATEASRFTRGLCNSLGKVNIKDALFCLEHDWGGKGTGLRVLIKNYVK
ncbi:transcription initiation factor TFIID component TAF4 family-domain-containing protein [Linnemannia elongata]|nr:transcription initiation factor TFIID component TAF4 family-domain-containing protein [Linnemannia elongata]